jgi:hypothetical protein
MECECVHCKNKIPFVLPHEIIDATINGNLVIFAGAGTSTETKAIFKNTLYEDIALDLNLSSNNNYDFPSLMSLYCKQNNGRRFLLEKIRNRFEYCHQFNELYIDATSFHRELSSIYLIDTIFTTNWDDYFERECNAIPIVTAEDFAFYNTSGRKVFKIHGSISNYGSIIATTEDYNDCYKNLNSGLMGGYLKTILATKTVVFIGFSFNDFDFNKIYSFLKKEMKDILPHCFIVTIDGSFKERFAKEKATVINTDGAYFLSVIRKHLEGSNYLIPKDNFETIEYLSFLNAKAHKFSTDYFFERKSTTRLYNLLYQDGLKHAFDYFIYHSKSGSIFNAEKIFNKIKTYEHFKKGMLKAKNYPDYAYVEGFIMGLYSIIDKNIINDFPFYYVIGVGHMRDSEEFISLLSEKEIYHQTADKVGKKYFKEYLDEKTETVPHHRPFIF